jgi:2-hydroxy-3-keto-5-methylthiopentenyl-1-phosphate phosphatase
MVDSWPTFLGTTNLNSEDLVGIMKKSVWHLRVCLEILDYVTDAVKDLRGVKQTERYFVRNEFLNKQTLLFQIFNDVFTVADEQCITRNL